MFIEPLYPNSHSLHCQRDADPSKIVTFGIIGSMLSALQLLVLFFLLSDIYFLKSGRDEWECNSYVQSSRRAPFPPIAIRTSAWRKWLWSGVRPFIAYLNCYFNKDLPQHHSVDCDEWFHDYTHDGRGRPVLSQKQRGYRDPPDVSKLNHHLIDVWNSLGSRSNTKLVEKPLTANKLHEELKQTTNALCQLQEEVPNKKNLKVAFQFLRQSSLKDRACRNTFNWDCFSWWHQIIELVDCMAVNGYHQH